jgi:hypothetical protein
LRVLLQQFEEQIDTQSREKEKQYDGIAKALKLIEDIDLDEEKYITKEN